MVGLPLSLRFRYGTGREGTEMYGETRYSSLVADYPAEWPQVKRDLKRGVRTCQCCGDPVERHMLQLGHLDWDPGNLQRSNLLPMCPNCHRPWDKIQQGPAAILTAAGERTLPFERYVGMVKHVRQEVGQHGLIMLSPAALDLAVAASLQDGALPLDELPERLERWFPMVVAALEEGGEGALDLALDSALARLQMRRQDGGGHPFVWVRGGWVKLSMRRLHLPEHITETPVGRWTNPRYIKCAA